jgi:recombinational DNA repair protein RecR
MSPSAKTTGISTRKSTYEKQMSEEEWQCQVCTMINLTSTKRCDACGKQRHTRFSSIDETKDTLNVENYDDYTSLYNSHRKTNQKDRPESTMKGKYLSISGKINSVVSHHPSEKCS